MRMKRWMAALVALLMACGAAGALATEDPMTGYGQLVFGEEQVAFTSAGVVPSGAGELRTERMVLANIDNGSFTLLLPEGLDAGDYRDATIRFVVADAGDFLMHGETPVFVAAQVEMFGARADGVVTAVGDGTVTIAPHGAGEPVTMTVGDGTDLRATPVVGGTFAAVYLPETMEAVLIVATRG